jgi:CRP/FNR family transcriptional regulator, cyclic AMP receptor protein
MSDPRAGRPSLVLSDHPFFAGMDPNFVARLSAMAVDRAYETGDELFREGEPATDFLSIFSGKVALELATAERPRLTIETVGPGDVLGWSWLSPPYRWRFDARALKATRALSLDATRLRAELEARPEDGYRFLLRLLPTIGERLEMARVQILDVHGA